jgi:hypothetical protein
MAKLLVEATNYGKEMDVVTTTSGLSKFKVQLKVGVVEYRGSNKARGGTLTAVMYSSL